MTEFTCVHNLEHSDCEECWVAKVDREAYEQDEIWRQEDDELGLSDGISGDDHSYYSPTMEVYEAEISLRDMYRVLSDEVSEEFYSSYGDYRER